MSSAPAPADDRDDALDTARRLSRQLKVHRRQAVLLCSLIQNAAVPGEADPKWQEALTSLLDRLTVWSKLSLVDAYFASEDILEGLLYLYNNEFRWCGLVSEEAGSQLLEQRTRDHADLLDSLRNIATSQDLLDEVLRQPQNAISYFIKAIQSAIDRAQQPTTLNKLQLALKFLYKSAKAPIPTPILTTQITSLLPASEAPSTNPFLAVYDGDWLESETVTVKVIRALRSDDNAVIKRFLEKTSSFYYVKHGNIIRVHGTMFDSVHGCCMVYPQVPAVNILTHLVFNPTANVLPLLEEVASGLHFLHTHKPPILHGDLRAENVLIMDDGTACLSDYGIIPIVGSYGDALMHFLRWMAPELIRAEMARSQGEQVKLPFNTCTDMYAFGCLLYEVFTSSEPLAHIREKETLETEVLHGMRPSVSNEAKLVALSRGWTGDLEKLMKTCLDADQRRRLSIDKAKDVLIAEMLEKTALSEHRVPSSPGSTYTRRSGSSSGSSSEVRSLSYSVRSPSLRSSWRASSTTGSFPPTPLTHNRPLSAMSAAPPTIASGSGSSGRDSREPPYLGGAGNVFDEPCTDNGLLRGGRGAAPMQSTEEEDEADDLIMMMQRGPSTFRASSENNSNPTIRPHPQSSFSDDESDSDEGVGSIRNNLGRRRRQRESTAYARMPKLQASSINSSRRRAGNDRFRILVDRMTESGRLHQNWVGVAPMEELRALTPRQVRQIRGIEELVKKESAFLDGNAVADQFARMLRGDPGVLGVDRLEAFLTNVTEDSRTLRQFSQQFRDALQARPNVTIDGFQQVALLCKEAGAQFAIVYPEYIRHLPEVEDILKSELARNDRFAEFMKYRMTDGRTMEAAMNEFLVAPVTHLKHHPEYINFIVKDMPDNDRDAPTLKEAVKEMKTAVCMTNLSAWQQYGSDVPKTWNDFVSPHFPRSIVDAEAGRQSEIFKLISDERSYVATLRSLETKILHRVRVELVNNARRPEDEPMRDIIKGIADIISDISRFHGQLLDNFYTIQRTQHPFIGQFVSACGVDQVPWHSLYKARYGTTYERLATLVQENKIRPEMLEALNRITLEETGELASDFMSCLRAPSKYLRDCAMRLRAISEATPEGNEDKEVLMEVWPRVWDVSNETEVMTSASREKARLSRLAAALNLSKYPGLENDIEIRSNARTLYVSGQLLVTIKQGREEISNTFYAVLLDNYLLLADTVSELGIMRLDVCEKPMPLDLIRYATDDSLNTAEKISCGLLDYSGSPRRTIHLFSDAPTAKMWSGKLKSAIQKRIQDAEEHVIMDLKELNFVRRFRSAPTCSAEFFLDGPITVIASDSPDAGLFVQKGTYEPHRALALSNIVRMSAIAELKMLLVLADKTLYYIRFSDLVNYNKPPPTHVLDDGVSVSFYRVGYLPDRTFLVALAKKKERNVIRFFEGLERVSSPGMLRIRSRRSPFRLVAEVEQPAPIRDICFLKARLVLVAANSFLLVDITSEDTIKNSFAANRLMLPLEKDSMTAVVDRCNRSTAISIHRVDTNFIICYSDFAAYLNENGQLSSRVVEWVSNDARGIAFRPPHMLVIGSAAVEIREMATGKLVQLLPAPKHLHLSWVGRYSDDAPNDVGVHLVMGKSAANNSPHGEQFYAPHAAAQYSLFKLLRR